MRALFLIFLALCSPVLVGNVDNLIGTWKLVSWQVIVENEPPQIVFGLHPKGFLILTREGRIMVLTTAARRRKGMRDAERAALHKSMLAYSGKYRVEGDELITLVDASWNEEWNGTEQKPLESRATSCSLSRCRRQLYCFQVRPISAGSSGNERNSQQMGHRDWTPLALSELSASPKLSRNEVRGSLIWTCNAL